MEVVGIIAAVIIGFSLGLIGSGGAILTLPALVYLCNVPTAEATSYSLFIVGITSMVGAFSSWKNRHVEVKTAVSFGIPSIAMVYVTRHVVMPLIPSKLFIIDHIVITRDWAIMMLFAAIMLLSSFLMIKDGNKIDRSLRQHRDSSKQIKLFFYGIVIGLIMGVSGAGGGFLIIPALIVLAGLPMKKAVGTSLTIMAMCSLVGFLGDTVNHSGNWKLLLTITLLSVLGVVAGIKLSNYIPGRKLKHAFGWFVLATSIYILISETILQ
jgi:uncharacterized membrane protein YfcA